MNKGKVIKGTGTIIGNMFELNLLVTGAILGGIVILAGRKDMGKAIRTSSKTLGKFAGKAVKISAGLIATMLEASKNEGYELGKAIGKRAIQSRIRIYGDAKQFFDTGKIIEADFKQTE